MAVSWVDITNAQVAFGASLNTALMTALRDNPEGIAQRATGAPKIFGVAYDYQEFTTNGTWTKPNNAETGDKVFVQVVGGGAGSGTGAGAGGAGGLIKKFEDINDLGATEDVLVAAGGIGSTNGGSSSFGTGNTINFLRGEGGTFSGTGGPAQRYNTTADIVGLEGVNGGDRGSGGPGDSSIFGGGGGCESTSTLGGLSVYAGNGGDGSSISGGNTDGAFPGGAGGSFGDGGDGVVRVWCIKEQ